MKPLQIELQQLQQQQQMILQQENSDEMEKRLKGFATFWEFSFYGQKKFADYEYHSLFAEKVHFHT